MTLSTGRPGRRLLTVHKLMRQGRLSTEEVDGFLDVHDFPLVEGASCTFVFRGEADEVHLRHWIFGLPSTQPFVRMQKSDLWFTILELPEGSRMEYKIEVTRGGVTELIMDPLNEARAYDPFGANSVAYGAGYEVPEWTLPDPEVRPGVLQELAVHSEALGGPRRVTLYLPARFRPSRRYPLLVVHDGPDYLQYSGLKTVLDNLIHRLEIPGVVAALTHPEKRLVEYGNPDAHARYLTEELVPKLEGELPLQASPRGRCLMGASFGAVASLATAYRYPDFYGRLLLQSGSFAFTDIGDHRRGPHFDPIVEFVNAYRAEPIRVAEKLFMSCGMYESLIYENRSMLPLLQATGMNVRYAESRDGHNWENWRDRLREGLSWLFPGPLWMVYE